MAVSEQTEQTLRIKILELDLRMKEEQLKNVVEECRLNRKRFESKLLRTQFGTAAVLILSIGVIAIVCKAAVSEIANTDSEKFKIWNH